MTEERRIIGLYGSHSGDWREITAKLLRQAGIVCYDPTDSRWQGITHENGDAMQDLIDELVAEQHRGMLNATCVIYHLASEVEYINPSRVPNLDNSGTKVAAPAARCELGFLTGKGIQTFVHLEPDVEGRNYLWAQMKPYSHMVRCATLVEASEEAIAYLSSHG